MEEKKNGKSAMFDQSVVRDADYTGENEIYEEEHIDTIALTDEERENLTKASEEYSGKDIVVLEGLEPVRQRPGMYIGNTNTKGLHHLIREIVDNAVDEALAGFCSEITVVLKKNDEVLVTDNGRGIPCDKVGTTSKSGVETIFTVLHAGGKFDGSQGYKVSGGLHGVGASVVNALSRFVDVKVYREGKIHHIRFENGGKTVGNGLEIIGECDPSFTGTHVHFRPDERIFTESTTFDYYDLKEYLKQTAYLNRGLSITLIDERDDEDIKENTFKFDGGIAEYVEALNSGKSVLFKPALYFEGEAEVPYIDFQGNEAKRKIYAEIAMQPTDTSVTVESTFCNNIFTVGKGTHFDGYKNALPREMNKYFRLKGWLKDNDDSFTFEDCSEGLTVVISVKHPDPQYEGQVKDKLGNAEVRRVVSSIITDRLHQFLMEHPNEGKAWYTRICQAYKSRKASEKARNSVRNKSGLSSSMPDKLADCISKDPAERELFIVEGNSAGGSAKDGRDSHTQAILPLRGKILNVEKSAANRIEKNEEINSLIQAIGGGSGDSFDVSKIRYHKVIIMTDADVDGSHIRILLLTFFYRYMKPLVEQGYVYVACPPLYQVKYNNHVYYCFKEEELKEIQKKLPANAKYKLQRYKGLGEMDAHQLAETTMEKEHRYLLKVTIEDALEANDIMCALMGEDVQPRKEFISANAKYVKNLDI